MRGVGFWGFGVMRYLCFFSVSLCLCVINLFVGYSRLAWIVEVWVWVSAGRGLEQFSA